MSELLPSLASLARALRGPFNFLHPEPEEIYRLLPENVAVLPLPQRVYLADESATPLYGYPVLASDGMKALRDALGNYLRAEEEAQVAVMQRQGVDASG